MIANWMGAPVTSTPTRTGMRRYSLRILMLASLVSAGAGSAFGQPGVLFDRSIYQVAPGEFFDVFVLLDGDTSTPAAEPLANGLFSYGWRMEFESTKATIDGVTIPTALDYFGFVPGASLTADPGLAGAEGNIDQVTLTPYEDSLLATMRLQNLALAPDTYDLTLSLAPHFPTEQLFLDGQENVLDDTLVFGTARVVVAVPEPAGMMLAALISVGAGVSSIRRTRKSRRCARSS